MFISLYFSFMNCIHSNTMFPYYFKEARYNMNIHGNLPANIILQAQIKVGNKFRVIDVLSNVQTSDQIKPSSLTI